MTTPLKLNALMPLVRPHWTNIVAGAGLVFVASLISLVQPLASRNILDALGSGESVARPLAVLTVLVAVGALVLGIGYYLLTRTAEAVVLAGRHSLIYRIVRLTVPAMRTKPPGDL